MQLAFQKTGQAPRPSPPCWGQLGIWPGPTAFQPWAVALEEKSGLGVLRPLALALPPMPNGTLGNSRHSMLKLGTPARETWLQSP